MTSANQRVNPLPLTFLAAGALAWAVIIATIGAVGPGGALPHLIHSSHTEHFLAFYAIGVLSTAGLPNVRLKWIFLAMAAAALAFGIVRLFIIQHTRDAAVEDCLAEIGGGASALLPIMVGMHRQSFRIWRSQKATLAEGAPDVNAFRRHQRF